MVIIFIKKLPLVAVFCILKDSRLLSARSVATPHRCFAIMTTLFVDSHSESSFHFSIISPSPLPFSNSSSPPSSLFVSVQYLSVDNLYREQTNNLWRYEDSHKV